MNRTRLAALGLGAILAVGSLAMPLVTFAAGNNILVLPATTTITPAGSTGSSFTVEVVRQRRPRRSPAPARASASTTAASS